MKDRNKLADTLMVRGQIKADIGGMTQVRDASGGTHLTLKGGGGGHHVTPWSSSWPSCHSGMAVVAIFTQL